MPGVTRLAGLLLLLLGGGEEGARRRGPGARPGPGLWPEGGALAAALVLGGGVVPGGVRLAADYGRRVPAVEETHFWGVGSKVVERWSLNKYVPRVV